MNNDITKILKAALKTKRGRMNLAMAMTAPLRQRMDYASIGRKAFTVMQICEVCGQSPLGIFHVNIRLEKMQELDTPEGRHFICTKCYNETMDLLHVISTLPMEDIPLYTTHENIFVVQRVKERLENG